MGGFFTPEETNIVRGDEFKVRPLAVASVDCDSCGLYRTCKSPRMKPSGQGRFRVLIVAEAPGETEDEEGTQLVGKTGTEFRGDLAEIGFDLDRDFIKTNAVCCRPPGNATPTPLQIAACRKRLKRAIEEYDPNVIVALGKVAMDGLVGHRLSGRLGDSDPSMTDWAGCEIPDQELGRWILPTWHPSYIARCGRDPVLIRQLQDTIRRAVELSMVPIPRRDFLADCTPIYDVREAIAILRKARRRFREDYQGVDYETTGVKPHRMGHKIVSASIAFGNGAFAFPFFEEEEFLEEWYRYMVTDKIQKAAHGKKFEQTWTYVKLGYWPVIQHCTMLGAHSEHNRRLTNLKFQTYINFGVLGYDSDIDIYLKTTEAEQRRYGGNGFNRIAHAPKDKLLKYNAADSLFSRLLCYKQVRNLPRNLQEGLTFFSRAVEYLARAENNGLPLAVEDARRVEQELVVKLASIEDEIRRAPELKKWDRSVPFSPSKDADLTHLVFDLMGHQVRALTATGRPKADRATMEKIDLPIVRKVIEWNKWDKARSTYVHNFVREAVNGQIHPVFNLQFVDTYRSSSDSPNFQNLPKRDKEVMRLIRSLLRPHPGHRLTEYDYKAVEVCISACYNRDPNLIKYVSDPTTDMHRDTAMDLFIRDLSFFEDPKTMALGKVERQVAKNAFVFPEFYGSYYEQVAPDIWGDIPAETKEHLKENGIRNSVEFTEHVQEIERIFWEERFPVYAEWKRKTYRDYEKRGYIDSYTGFRYQGPMRRNEVVNYPIQGSAFHCLLWTLLHVMRKMETEGLDSRFIGQIHDAAVGSIHPDEETHVDQLIWFWGTQKIREYWEWIVVPLRIEKSQSEIDGNWAEMSDCGVLEF